MWSGAPPSGTGPVNGSVIEDVAPRGTGPKETGSGVLPVIDATEARSTLRSFRSSLPLFTTVTVAETPAGVRTKAADIVKIGPPAPPAPGAAPDRTVKAAKTPTR